MRIVDNFVSEMPEGLQLYTVNLLVCFRKRFGFIRLNFLLLTDQSIDCILIITAFSCILPINCVNGIIATLREHLY